ncbi:serine/threonine protein kinase [Myxococcus llanfairpwllgwyngyllgogerychwyrndrobwllllantysiliogogogochensis]|uniref:non-specific serine/threonine protein kinase n=1 Tax=Myxococcus llanfairpwllgwyngyllgogerychwyrndrobwllllantysiliogogogochensis TaxID=2590453 RepID=A0A540X0E3_9BACT|nr:serine/threonine protein kinase [Myxococcus llanfairpwllgwyngyllgogerychwyrndrobwllllantysiliogogogochensis]
MRSGPVDSQGSNAIISRLRVGTITHVRIAGVIDETFPLTSTHPELTGLLVVDLGRVERISSFGVRRWIEFAAKLPPGALGLYVVHAPPVVVDQLNMVEGFAGVARVLSVLAPYTCRTCNEDRMRVVNLVDEAQVIAEERAPEHTCPVCSNPLEFADLPSEFFDYARRQQFGTVDPVVMRYLRASMPTEQSELPQHLKIVQDDVTFISLASTLKGDLNVRRLASGLEGRAAFDFSHVSKVEPEALPKLEQVLDTAAQGAQVVLCRVPPPVLAMLARSSKLMPGRLATLWLPCECRNCGQVSHQRIQAHEYLAQLRAHQTTISIECPICGGSAQVPHMPQLQGFLARVQLTDRPLEDIEALEPRALSQYLFGSTNIDPQANKGSPTDISNSLGSTKLNIIRRLGQGGMAEVFLAKQVGVKGFEKFVVMKKILPQFAQNPEFVDMLFAEARANARLTHPNVVQTFDVGVSDGVAYILMEYVRGPDMKRLVNELRRKGMALPLEHALRIVAEVAAGLHYAHAYVDPAGIPHPVVHRDVSPHNVLISLDGAIKLSDFGIAKVAGEENTQAGVLKGKISYISPEAASGRTLDARNDVFALGVVLFELLTGQLPFRRDHDAATLNAIVRDPAPVPSQLRPQIPQDVSDLVLRALVKDPARRTPSAAAMREEIEAVMAHHRLNSSPAAVAQFFKDTLGDRLVEYAPSSASGTGSHPKPVPTGTGTGSGNVGSGDMVAPSDGRTPNRGTSSGPKPTTAGSGNIPRPTGTGSGNVSAPPVSSSVPRPAPVAPRPATPPPVAPRPPTPPPVAHRPPPPPPALTPPLPMLPELDASDRTEVVLLQGNVPPPPAPARPAPAPRPSQPGHTAVPAPQRPSSTMVPAAGVAPRPGQPRPSSPTHQSPVAAPRPPPPVQVHAVPAAADESERRSSLKWAAMGGGLLLVVAVVAVVLLRGSDSMFRNLEEGEHVYVGGVRLESGAQTLPAPPSGPLLIATAVNGKLRRFGTTQLREDIDVRTLADAMPQPGTRGVLSVASSAPGCQVQVDGAPLPNRTPVNKASIEAGRELEVVVSCPGAASKQWVLAVPGQEIVLTAQQHD